MKNEVASLKTELKQILESNQRNMLSMQDQITDMRNQAQNRDDSIKNELRQVPTSNVQFRASVSGAIDVQSDKFEGLIRFMFETQRDEIRK